MRLDIKLAIVKSGRLQYDIARDLAEKVDSPRNTETSCESQAPASIASA